MWSLRYTQQLVTPCSNPADTLAQLKKCNFQAFPAIGYQNFDSNNLLCQDNEHQEMIGIRLGNKSL